MVDLLTSFLDKLLENNNRWRIFEKPKAAIAYIDVMA